MNEPGKELAPIKNRLMALSPMGATDRVCQGAVCIMSMERCESIPNERKYPIDIAACITYVPAVGILLNSREYLVPLLWRQDFRVIPKRSAGAVYGGQRSAKGPRQMCRDKPKGSSAAPQTAKQAEHGGSACVSAMGIVTWQMPHGSAGRSRPGTQEARPWERR